MKKTIIMSSKKIRVPELAIGLSIVVVCVLGSLLWGGASDVEATKVLVASRDLERGHLISDDDLTSVEISSSSDVPLLDVSLAPQVVGLRTTTDVSSGSPLTEGQLGRRAELRSDEGLVGLVVTADQAPAELASGDIVDVVAVSRESDGGVTREQLPTSMEVWDVTEPDPMTGDRSVTLRVNRVSAPQIVGHDEVHLVKVGQS